MKTQNLLVVLRLCWVKAWHQKPWYLNPGNPGGLYQVWKHGGGGGESELLSFNRLFISFSSEYSVCIFFFFRYLIMLAEGECVFFSDFVAHFSQSSLLMWGHVTCEHYIDCSELTFTFLCFSQFSYWITFLQVPQTQTCFYNKWT